MYGFFKCPDCNGKWESAKVYYKNTYRKEYYGQECKRCKTMCTPYRVEETTCSVCGMKARSCGCDKTRHTDPTKAHRSDLCEKCKRGRPCAF